MATDPVQTIQHEAIEQPFFKDVRGLLSRLAELPPSLEAPYVTLSLDWRPQGSSPANRSALRFIQQERDRILAEHEAHTPPHESLSADFERIGAYVESEVDPATQGLIIFACNARSGYFRAVPLPLPVENRLTLSVTPALVDLVRLADDASSYAALALDQREAHLLLIDQGAQRGRVNIEGSDFPRKQQQGGWSQRRYQSRAEERVEAFVRTVAEEVQRELETANIDQLVLGGDEQITSLFSETVHQTVQAKIVGTTPFDIRGSESEIVEATLPLAEQAEREQEAALIGRIENGIGPGGGAVHGAVETMTALQTGQVMTLVMNDDFRAPGWADFTFPLYGVGEPTGEHPGGGDVANLVPVALEEELVRLALQMDAEIEIIKSSVPTTVLADAEQLPEASDPMPRTEAARRLDALGGVAALLRYTLTEDQSTAEL